MYLYICLHTHRDTHIITINENRCTAILKKGFEDQNEREIDVIIILKKERKLKLKERSMSHTDCSHLTENK